MMFLIILMFTCGSLHAEYFNNSARIHDFMSQTDKNKLKILALALLKDAKLKERQVTAIKDEHSIFTAFEVGVVMGQIREKYKRMLETYREARDRYTNRTLLIEPGMEKLRPFHYIISMETIHMREVDIDKLIEILEAIPKKLLDPTASPFVTKKSKKFKGGDTKLALRIKEEEYKSKLRDEFTMKKLGVNKTGWGWDVYSNS